MQAKLLEFSDGKAKLQRQPDKKVFTTSIDIFNESSQKKIKKQAEVLAKQYPRLDLSVVVSKRRKTEGSSWYMKTMECSVTAKIKNTDRRDSPACHCNILLFGQDQRHSNKLEVLTNQEFKLAPKIGRTEEYTSKPVYTRYDSDSNGYGNVGGSKYLGYIFIVSDVDGNVIDYKIMSSVLEKPINFNPSLLDKLKKTAAKTYLNKELEKYESPY